MGLRCGRRGGAYGRSGCDSGARCRLDLVRRRRGHIGYGSIFGFGLGVRGRFRSAAVVGGADREGGVSLFDDLGVGGDPVPGPLELFLGPGAAVPGVGRYQVVDEIEDLGVRRREEHQQVAVAPDLGAF